MNTKGTMISLKTEDDTISMSEYLNKIDFDKVNTLQFYFMIHCHEITKSAKFNMRYKHNGKYLNAMEIFNVPQNSLLIDLIERAIEDSKVPYMAVPNPSLLDYGIDKDSMNYILYSDDIKDLIEFIKILSDMTTVYTVLDDSLEVNIIHRNDTKLLESDE